MSWHKTLLSYVQPRIWLAVVLMIGLTACSGLGGEPAIIATFPPESLVSNPPQPPDMARGAMIFAQRCSDCHGPNGAGDGSLIGPAEGQIPFVPESFLDTATAEDQSPVDWYLTITNGRIERLMPPWREALTEQERWDVALYTYALRYPADGRDTGSSLLTAQGITIAQPEARWFGLTDRDMVSRLGRFNADEQLVVAAYLRSLGVANWLPRNETANLVTPTPAGTLQISGQVTNGTTLSQAPADLETTLYVVSDRETRRLAATVTDAQGAFTFSGLTLSPEQRYWITVSYQGRLFASAMMNDPSQPAGVVIYEITSDPQVITLTGVIYEINLSDSELIVTQLMTLRNDSDSAYSTDKPLEGDRYASIEIPIPTNARVISFDSSDARFGFDESTRAVVDTAAVLPGQDHLIQIAYALPYTGQVDFEQTLGYGADGPVRILIPDGSGLSFTSSDLPALGQQAISNQVYQGYGRTLNQTSTTSIRFSISGGLANTSTAGNLIPADRLLILLMIVLACIIIGVAAFFRFRSPQRTAESVSDKQADILLDGLIRQIAELDEQHKQGEIGQATYERRRAKFKSRLTDMMDKSS